MTVEKEKEKEKGGGRFTRQREGDVLRDGLHLARLRDNILHLLVGEIFNHSGTASSRVLLGLPVWKYLKTPLRQFSFPVFGFVPSGCIHGGNGPFGPLPSNISAPSTCLKKGSTDA